MNSVGLLMLVTILKPERFLKLGHLKAVEIFNNVLKRMVINQTEDVSEVI